MTVNTDLQTLEVGLALVINLVLIAIEQLTVHPLLVAIAILAVLLGVPSSVGPFKAVKQEQG